MPESLTGAWQQAIDRRAPELEERVFVFLNEQLRRMLSRYVRGQQPMTADENTWLTRILVDYYDRDLARDLLKEPPPGATEEEAKSYKTIYGTVESLDEVFRIMQSHQDAASQARLVNETTRKILEQFLTGGDDNTPDAVRSFLMSNPNFSNVTKPEFEALVKNISQQVEETYRNRARTIARTELAIAQSKTVAQELRAQGKTHVRIYDGLGCGWRHHDDGDYANGSLRRIEDYLNYPVAHPNCVRAGYPDFFGGDGSIHVGKKDLDLFETKSLEAVSANQKSLDGVSNRPDGFGGPLDLLEGSERVRKYNPNHDRLGRFASGSGSGVVSEDDWEIWAHEADAIKSFQLDGSWPPVDSNGRRLTEEDHASLAATADRLQAAAESNQGNFWTPEGTVKGHTVYRGESAESIDALRERYPTGTVELRTLTSTSLERKVASGYAEEGSYGAARAILTFQNPNGVIGAQTSPGLGVPSAEVVLPKGAKYRVTRSLVDENGILQISLYSTEKLGKKAVQRKYNPYHDRLGRFSTGSGGGITSDDLDFAAGIKMLADLKVKNGDLDGVGDLYLAEINAQKGFNGKPQVLEGAEFEKAVQESPVGIMRRGIRNTGNFSTIDVMEDELSGAAVYTGLGIHGNGLYFGVARKLGDADDKRSKTVAQVFSNGAGMRGGATYRATLAKDARVVTVEDVTKAYFSEFGKDDALSRGSARFNSRWVMQDPGRLAAIKGFDAMLIKKADATGVISTSQVVVFNRTKLIWDGESVRSNSLEGGLKSWSLKFNPHHDRLGRFATTGGSGSFSDLESIEGVVPLDSVGDWEDEVVTSDLTDAQDMSVRYYVGRGYSEINGSLRGGPKPFNEAEFWGNLQDAGGKELVRNVKNLDAATKKHKLKKDTTVFRGVTGDGWDLKRWEDRGFTSTSLSPTVAGSFGNVVMAINLPKGTKGYAHLGMNGEYEFLLPRNMKYKLVDKPVKVKLDGKDVTVLTATLA